MLIHIVPKLFTSPGGDAEILDVSIPECGLILRGGKDITARQPYPNKRYWVACKKIGRKAISGILVDVDGRLPRYTVISRWLVDGNTIVHFVEHEVLDQEFDTVSDEMMLWHRHYNKPWEARWPACYDEAPVHRQPCMDVHPIEEKGLPRPKEVRDMVIDLHHVVCRVEPFKLHTIERERLTAMDYLSRRLPALQDAFTAKIVAIPDLSINLGGQITATLLLAPMPIPDAQGKYPKLTGKNQAFMPNVYLSFKKKGKLIASHIPWAHVINEDKQAPITEEVTLDEDQLFLLDTKGWGVMNKFGMFPTVFILSI